jgi:hypothetical protein
MQWQTIAAAKAKDRVELGQVSTTVDGIYKSTHVVNGHEVPYYGDIRQWDRDVTFRALLDREVIIMGTVCFLSAIS